MPVVRAQVPEMKYIDTLNEAWQQHLAPREPNAPTVISTFAGAGGSSLGYSMAGYRELLAVEWDNNAVETFKLNFPGVPVYHGDIAKLSVDECMKLAGLTGPRQLDVLDGSPPCQGFSTAGKRILDDPRNQLFREYVRLLRGLQPKVFVMENVSGMVKGKMKLVFAEIMRELKASGYVVSARLLNAMYFNVPQSRERMIFIGVRDDLGIVPSHPKAESRAVTTRNALALLPSDFDAVAPQVRGRVPEAMRNCKPGMSLAASTGDDKFFSWVRAAWDRPCMTVQKSVTFGGFSIWHPEENRSLTGRETARIGSWPDAVRFIGDYRDWIARIGNSVPPLFMRSIARHIRHTVLDNG